MSRILSFCAKSSGQQSFLYQAPAARTKKLPVSGCHAALCQLFQIFLENLSVISHLYFSSYGPEMQVCVCVRTRLCVWNLSCKYLYVYRLCYRLVCLENCTICGGRVSQHAGTVATLKHDVRNQPIIRGFLKTGQGE